MGLRRRKTIVERAEEYVENLLPQVEAAFETAREEAVSLAGELRDRVAPAVADARERFVPAVTDAVGEARERLAPAVAEARVRAQDAADRVGPALADARTKAAPYVATAAAAASEQAARVSDLASSQVAAQVAKVKGEPEPKRSKLKTLLVLGGVAGAVAFVAKKVQAGSASNAGGWQQSYVPAPPPAAPAPTAAPVGSASPAAPAPVAEEDVAGAAPDEAIADQVGEAVSPTTPDEPATVVEVEDPGTGTESGEAPKA